MFLEESIEESIHLSSAIDTCPHCGKSITPILISYHTMHGDDTNTYQYVICQCPSKQCNSIFFAKYSWYPFQIDIDEYDVVIENIEFYPSLFITTNFSKEIASVSPAFLEAYNQSETARANNLNIICGPGFRFAFELLVKDFACYLNPEKTKEIKQDISVSNVIANRIPDKPIFNELKDIAKRSWWLGCDFSHYSKKYSDLDIEDLKSCIDITVAVITYYLKRENYLAKISKP